MAGYGQKTTMVISSVIARELHSYLIYQLDEKDAIISGTWIILKKRLKILVDLIYLAIGNLKFIMYY